MPRDCLDLLSVRGEDYFDQKKSSFACLLQSAHSARRMPDSAFARTSTSSVRIPRSSWSSMLRSSGRKQRSKPSMHSKRLRSAPQTNSSSNTNAPERPRFSDAHFLRNKLTPP